MFCVVLSGLQKPRRMLRCCKSLTILIYSILSFATSLLLDHLDHHDLFLLRLFAPLLPRDAVTHAEWKSADKRWIQFLTETGRCDRGTEGNQPRICAEEAAELYLLKSPSRIADLNSRRRGGLPIAPPLQGFACERQSECLRTLQETDICNVGRRCDDTATNSTEICCKNMRLLSARRFASVPLHQTTRTSKALRQGSQAASSARLCLPLDYTSTLGASAGLTVPGVAPARKRAGTSEHTSLI
ncbi:hypothetical protein BDD12DRAFT_330443 [Trichophaea hybrida]|nr:hypothetical protein BDD12DRAFT_330443 [Trichophaea hybrida]